MHCNKCVIIDTEMETQILSILLELNGKMVLKSVEMKDSYIGSIAGINVIRSEKVDKYVLPGDETRFESDIIEHASSYNFSVSVFMIASSIAVSVCRNSVLMLLSVVSILCCDCDVVVVVLFVQPSPET